MLGMGIVIIRGPMKTRAFVFAFVLVLCPALAISQSPSAPQLATSVLVKAGKLLDVRNGGYIGGGALWIEGERIAVTATKPGAMLSGNACHLEHQTVSVRDSCSTDRPSRL